ncbi:MAG: fatty acid desaturase, partial [Paracoccaceae bacterium]
DQIDRAKKQVLFDGESLEYDDLVLALGSQPRRLHEKIGGSLGKVFTVRDLTDVDALAPEFTRDKRVLISWLWHIPAVAIVVWVFAHVALMPLWAFVVASYVGVSLLKIRTFLEHRAHVDARARTVVIEDRGFLAFLFLNNNFHSVHHMYPCVPWYRLPGLYAGRRTEFLTRNEGYRYGSYRQIFGRYLWTAKDPVPHPLWSRKR